VKYLGTETPKKVEKRLNPKSSRPLGVN